MSYPHLINSLSPREAVTDAIYRAIIGFDRNDVAIFNSAFAGEDATFEFHGTDRRDNVAGVRSTVLANVGPMDTTHTISNVRVDVQDGADTAHLTCYALAQHCPEGKGKDPAGPKYTTGAEYWVDLVRDEKDGLWKIKKWVMDLIWTQGDRSIMNTGI